MPCPKCPGAKCLGPKCPRPKCPGAKRPGPIMRGSEKSRSNMSGSKRLCPSKAQMSVWMFVVPWLLYTNVKHRIKKKKKKKKRLQNINEQMEYK